MKSVSLQALISRLFSDEATRKEFLDDPETVLQQHHLTDQERTAMTNSFSKLGLVTSPSAQMEAAISPTWEWVA